MGEQSILWGFIPRDHIFLLSGILWVVSLSLHGLVQRCIGSQCTRVCLRNLLYLSIYELPFYNAFSNAKITDKSIFIFWLYEKHEYDHLCGSLETKGCPWVCIRLTIIKFWIMHGRLILRTSNSNSLAHLNGAHIGSHWKKIKMEVYFVGMEINLF